MAGVSRLIGRRSSRWALIVGVAALCGFAALAVSLSKTGDAAYPGLNGRIAFSFGGTSYNNSIWSANSDGTAPAQLTVGTSDYDPAYSPNGTRIAFNRGNNIIAMNADGSSPVQLSTGSSSSNSQTTWQENYDDPDSTDIIPWVRIQTSTEKSNGLFSPSFSPDGSQLAVSESVYDSVFKSICAVEGEGDNDCLDYSDPESYFDFEFQCNNCSQRIITINSTTGALTSVVTPVSSEFDDFLPAYSVNGQIAFVRSGMTSASSGIFVVNAPGAPPVQLTSGFGDSSPDFSPDGTRIVFRHSSKELGVIPATGGAITLLPLPLPPPGTSFNVQDPVFSPDGTQVAFRRTVFAPKTAPQHGLFAMGIDGSNFHAFGDGFEPSWQPVPPPPPPPVIPSKANGKKGKVKLDKKGKAVIGSITCGSSPCSLKVLSSKLKAGKKKCSPKIKAPKKLAPTKTGKVTATVAGKCLKALKKAGKGSLVAKIKVTDATGQKVLTLKSTLLPGKAGKSGKGKGGKSGKGKGGK